MMTIYNKLRSVPAYAKKKITGGKLKGFTDINPMWRIKMLTETFGPSGKGWYTSDVRHWTEMIGNKAAVFCELYLRVKFPGSTEWSCPIYGVGGNMLTQGAEGLNDDAFKMAYTDALSIACKALGMAADVYFDKDAKTRDNMTKYDQQTMEEQLDDIDARLLDQTPSQVKQLSNEEYWRMIAAAANGQMVNGETIKDWWMKKYKPSANQVRRFDLDLDNYLSSSTI